MEQFCQIGEVLGSLKALMVFSDNVPVNKRQCCLLLDMSSFAYEIVAEEMKLNLRFEEKHVKWKILESPLKEMYKIFKEVEGYVKYCLEIRDWWAKMITLYHNTDCVEFYIHNLLTCIPIVIEAIEIVAEFSGNDQEEIQKKRYVFAEKYQKQWKDPKLFQWKFGKQYLVTTELRNRYATVSKEDHWLLLNNFLEKSVSGSTKHKRQLTDLVLKNLRESDDSPNGKLLQSSILTGSKDYQVRRRLGTGSQYKEILWLGESFGLRHFFGDIESLIPEISSLLSLTHPNIVQYLCGFTDEEKKECFLVMELMSKDLSSYIKETCGPRKRIPFSLLVAVDLMLQIARGMEYLHSKKFYHGNLSTSRILVKQRTPSTDGYLQAKVSEFGLSSITNLPSRRTSNHSEIIPFIWYAPEVLEEQEKTRNFITNTNPTEKADVYSFAMVSFELLTGKVPFEDGHLQGEKVIKNILTGERPLFPFHVPKYLANLMKRCWHEDTNQRPNFSSVCRILRYTKRFLLMNPDHNRELDPPTPTVDYSEIDSMLTKTCPSWNTTELFTVSQIPFQIFMYRVVEKEKTRATRKEVSDSGSDKASVSGDENVMPPVFEDPVPTPSERRFTVISPPEPTYKRLSKPKKSLSGAQPIKVPGMPRSGSFKETRSLKPPQMSPQVSPQRRKNFRLSSESQLNSVRPRVRRSASGPVSDSELA